ncbi:cbb3-type cytochrome c oxidase N-terminal domain-containing protein [Rubripirellula reticaptiva]|uniref:Cbb3-type cytochrome c oxidase subunit CcoP2 n=1 Tax=Rubripirellula reticaptiva TaxID=2528013 RepID=A0A5C6F6Z3_9BACT|nr:cbb3-type cytochrome c oxidase N-terminal domain-containing protein [Rubripirellula reticaptiva]TWU55251.1 Cbb3-type cytochrome c oxidase subunit CcoP2 [Rubripirellula reticaptiva]
MSKSQSNGTNSSDESLIMDHAYDGIEEYDNPLPGWWKWLFVGCIAFSPFYWMFYHGGAAGRSVEDQYGIALAANTRLQFAEIGELSPDEATIVKYMHKDSWVKVGESVFKANCISCHGRDGEGKIGPNLTDEMFKNVNKIEDIAKVINEGAGGGAMPKWSNRLHPNEVVLVSAYVASLRGKDLAGRIPEGKKIAEWPAAPPEEDEEEKEE